MLIHPSTVAAFGHEQGVAGLQQLAEYFAGLRIAHFGAWRDRHIDIVGGLTSHVFSLPMLAPLSHPPGVIAIIEQRREVGIGLHVHAPADTAIAAVRAALRHELFAAKGARTRTAGSGDDLDYDAVDEHCGLRIADCGFDRGARRAV